ncbi:MAG TPA: DUF748 domain-containing protein [Rhodocyclaceae bacterium]|nr:DUF748 domain-containing protein [Rhodocyclaceae bacterium]
MAKRVALITLALLIVLATGAAVGLHFAAATLKEQVRMALGPESQVGDITLGWSAVEVRSVRVPGPKDWPADDALRAERITVTPDFKALFSQRQVRINRIEVQDAYLSVFRTRDGKLRLLPGIVERKPVAPAAAQESAAVPVTIDMVELHGSALELFDASVARPAHRIRLENLEARVEDLRLPELDTRTRLHLEGVIKGVQRDGRFTIQGQIQLASRDSEIATRLRGVDLVALQPYLVKASETGVKRGSLDLDLESSVRQQRLHAPGTLTLTQLELLPGKGAMGTFMGMPRDLVISLLKNANNQIALKFVLEGRLDDPRFSLNEALMKRIGASMAEGLGISLESVAKSVSGTTQGIGASLGKLFGRK